MIPTPFSRDLPDAGIEPRSPYCGQILLPSDPPRKPQNLSGSVQKLCKLTNTTGDSAAGGDSCLDRPMPLSNKARGV